MYLAEDRILCFELIAKPNCRWVLSYIKNAVAVTDVPDTLTALIRQRRRWLNGSFYAMLYALMHFNKFLKHSKHSIIRKTLIIIQFVYLGLSATMSWFLIANFYLSFFILIRGALIDTAPLAVSGLEGLYTFLLATQLVLGLGNKPQKVAGAYQITAVLFGLIMIGLFGLSVVYAVQGTLFVQIAGAASFAVFFLTALFHGEFGHVVISFCQYMLMLPSFVNILIIYAFCNTHDLSWGTKGIDSAHGVQGDGENGSKKKRKLSAASEKQQMLELKAKVRHRKDQFEKAQQNKDRLEEFRSMTLLLWAGSNAVAVAIVTSVFKEKGKIIGEKGDQLYMDALFYIVAFFSVIRFAGSCIYLVLRQYPAYKLRRQRLKAAKQPRFDDDDSITNPMEVQLSQNAIDAGWEAVTDPASGKVYFQNLQTNTTQWDMPTDDQLISSNSAEDPDAV